jgi:hypothetical protein
MVESKNETKTPAAKQKAQTVKPAVVVKQPQKPTQQKKSKKNNQTLSDSEKSKLLSDLTKMINGAKRMSSRDAGAITAFVKNKIDNSKSTFMFLGDNELGKNMFFRVNEINSVLNFAAYKIGSVDSAEVVTNISDLNKQMEETIEKAYQAGIGDKRKIEYYAASLETATAEESGK